MVPPSERFRPIQKIVSQKERKAAAALGESLKRREAARVRLDERRSYLTDYLDRFSGAARTGLSSRQILEYQVFIGKLETAIAQQEEIVAQSQQACDSNKARWRGRYTRSKAMDNAVGLMHKEERKDQERKEQSEADDRAQRKR
ncbi:MAG: flagellar export protein FliJ [Sedimenticolaceae bacterium]